MMQNLVILQNMCQQVRLLTSAPRESDICPSVAQMSSNAPSEPISSTSKHVDSNVNKRASDRQLELVGKAFMTDGKSKKLYFVAEVKYLEDYEEVCCCCVPAKPGDVDGMKTLVEKAKKKGVYGSSCALDCEYVQRRVVVYQAGGELRS